MIEEFLYIGIVSFLLISIPLLRKLFFLKRPKNIVVKKNKRYEYFDFLRGLAILAVILIHIGDFLYRDGTGSENFLLFINDILRFAVPFFLISSGILLLKKNSLIPFYSKKIVKIYLPFFFITVLIDSYYGYGYSRIFFDFIAGSASPPYYFLTILLQLYIIYPLLLKVSKYKYFLNVTFFISIISFFFIQSWAFMGIPVFLKYLFLFSYGIYYKDRFLADVFLFYKKELVFYLVLIIFYLFYSWYFNVYFYNIRVFYAIALFNLAFIFKESLSGGILYNFFIYLGKNSLWIYLIHYFVIQLIYTMIKNINENFYLKYLIFVLIGIPFSILSSIIFKYIYQLIIKLVIPNKIY